LKGCFHSFRHATWVGKRSAEVCCDCEEAKSIENNAVEKATEGQRNSLNSLVVQPFLPIPVADCEAIPAVLAVHNEE